MREAIVRLVVALLCFSPCLPGSARAADEPTADTVPRFDVREFRVEGNTLLATTAIERTLYPFLGEGKQLPDVEAARQELERRYREAGYVSVLVDIPEQRIDAGVVRLKVTEGSIEELRITGSRYFTSSRLREFVPGLAEGTVMNTAAVQRELAALNAASPDRAVTPVIRPGRTPGTMEAELKVKDELPLHGALEVNDRYSRDTSKTRASASLRYDNLWQLEHGISLQYQTAPEEPSEVRVWSGTYIARAPQLNSVIALYGVKSESETATVGDLAVIGTGNIYGLRDIVLLPGDAGYSHTLTLGVDYKDFKESVRLQGADAVNTPIDYAAWSVQYAGTARSDAASTRTTVGLNVGLRGVSEDRVDCLGQRLNEFECKRHLAKPNFAALRIGAEHTRRLVPWLDLFVKLDGQLTGDPLISNEQYGAGGADSVRGYTESAQLGDVGATGTLEARFPLPRGEWAGGAREFYASLFTDGAALRVLEPLPGQEHTYELSSVGIGARLTALAGWSLALDAARVFKDSGDIESGDARAHFRIEYAF